VNRLSKKIARLFRYGEQGFTLIELLIVIAVLGALAGVVAPNVSNMMGSANVAAANTEVSNVKTAANSYLADQGVYPTTSTSLNSTYLSGTPKATYPIDASSGNISGAPTGITWTGVNFVVATQKWVKD